MGAWRAEERRREGKRRGGKERGKEGRGGDRREKRGRGEITVILLMNTHKHTLVKQ